MLVKYFYNVYTNFKDAVGNELEWVEEEKD